MPYEASRRLTQLPPYVFVEIDRLKRKAAARGADIISFGIGDPDLGTALADIRGHPVMDRGRVFAVSHSGRMVAIDLRTGVRAWEQRIGGTQTPWVAGDFLYVLTTEGQLVCLSWSDGRIRWVLPLQRFEDEEEQEDPIIWTGPVLAGDRLIVAGSHSEVLSISPYTGTIMGWLKTSEAVLIPPVVAGNTIYLLTEDADLIALR